MSHGSLNPPVGHFATALHQAAHPASIGCEAGLRQIKRAARRMPAALLIA